MKNIILTSTISNYILLIFKIILSLLLVRIMFLGISQEEYGFWALLWTIFGYSLLLDFGFGTAVLKATSEASAKNSWIDFDETISTVFFSYAILSIIILIFTFAMATNLENIFVFSNTALIDYYKNVFYIFGLGTALIFPLGFFREILRGLQKIKLRNTIDLIFLISNFILLFLCVRYNYSLVYMAIVVILIQLFTNMIMAFYVFKHLPKLKISYKFFKKQRVYELMSFSLFAYFIMFSNVIIFRTDVLVISMFSSLALVALYQIVSRLTELFRQFSTQIHDIIAPLASYLFVKKDHNELHNILFITNKVIGFISTLIFIPTFIFIEELLFFYLEIRNEELVNTAKILLFSMYILVFLRSSCVQVLLMCNKHKQLAFIAVCEAILNLVLSIYLIKYYSIMGVALGTLIPNLFFAVFYNIPASCIFSKVSILYFLKEIVIKTLLLAFFILLVLEVILTYREIETFFHLATYSILTIFIYSIL